jgi:Flp pilus assembly pilin Flp
MGNAEENLENQAPSKSGLWADTRGDTGFVEWLLLVGLIAIAGFVAFQTIGKNVSTKADEAGQKILDVKFDGTP